MKRCLFDTNVLVYALDEDSPYHAASARLIGQANQGELEAHITQQVLLECFAVVTNPKRVAHPLSTSEALELIQGHILDSPLRLLSARDEALMLTWHLAESYQLIGSEVFDAYLVATALTHGILNVYSGDVLFARFKEITHVNPFKKV